METMKKVSPASAMNADVRKAMHKAGAPFWVLADLCGVSTSTLFRWFRHEMTDEMKAEMINRLELWAKEKQ